MLHDLTVPASPVPAITMARCLDAPRTFRSLQPQGMPGFLMNARQGQGRPGWGT
ncbi:hypothetical protein ACFOPN_18875 [Xanthomonas hyacinthi]|uniref:hypothetical protein n=1 Tax=Xanthomonas hyacinthi TaxID=56455 RepID=UPI00361F00F9